MLGLPNMGSLNTYLVLSIVSWIAKAAKGGDFDLSIYPTVAVQPVDNARNEIVRTFLESDATHLLFIDSDTVPPPDAIERLLAMDKYIATAITPIVESDDGKEFYRKWNVVTFEGMHAKPNMGIVPAIAAGSSCIMIRREVFESMAFPWYRFEYQDDQIISEDIYFTNKANSAGFKAYADTSLICQHAKVTMW